MSNKTQLQTNNTNLQSLIDRVNAAKQTASFLPEAGSGIEGIEYVNGEILISDKTEDVYFYGHGGNIVVGEDCDTYLLLEDNGHIVADNLDPENIKSGVNILGVEGEYSGGSIPGISYNSTYGMLNVAYGCRWYNLKSPSISQMVAIERNQSIPYTEYMFFDKPNISSNYMFGVTATSTGTLVSAPNLEPENIKSGVDILGVTGTYGGSGGGLETCRLFAWGISVTYVDSQGILVSREEVQDHIVCQKNSIIVVHDMPAMYDYTGSLSFIHDNMSGYVSFYISGNGWIHAGGNDPT